MKRTYLIWTALLTVALLCAGCAEKPPRALYEEAGKFSYDPPPGWQVVEFPGLDYRVAHGPAENAFAPNINVVDERFSGELADYVDANLSLLRELNQELRVLSREDLETEDGEAAIQVVTEAEWEGRPLRQTLYFLESGDRKYVVTCTALADGGESLDQVFAESVATFRMH